jgi:hypothetical protein
MSNNPLKQYFRRPAVYLSLPSQGKYYTSDTIDMPENGELPVYPMTAIDEITTKTPDALFNGTAVVELIKSCVPNIKDPWKINSIDLDALFIAIKAASGGQQLEIESTCPKCNDVSQYGLELAGILGTLKAPDYSQPLDLGELKIVFGPLTYDQMNQAGLAQFNIQKTLVQINQMQNEEEKVQATKNALIGITETTIELIAKTIMKVITPTVEVDSYEHIVEFLSNCDKALYENIRDYHTRLKAESEMPPLDIQCANCNHQYKQPFTLNVTDFFG